MTLFRCCFLLLAVWAALQMPVAGQSISGFSDITIIGNTQVASRSVTELDYAASLYYDPRADGFLTRGGSIVQQRSMVGGFRDPSDGALYASFDLYTPLVPNTIFQIQTNHWIRAYYTVTVESTIRYEDPFGFSLISTGNYEGNTTQYPPNVYTTTFSQDSYIGATYRGFNSYTPIISGLAPDSDIQGTTGYLVIYGQYLDNSPGTNPGVSISGGGVTLGPITYAGPNQINVAYSIDPSASTGDRTLSVSTLFGSGSGTFGVLPRVTISGSEGVPLNGNDSFQVTFATPSPGEPVTLRLETQGGSGSAQFSDGSSSIVLTDSQVVTIVGSSASSTADNVVLLAQVPRRNRTIGERRLSVVSVTLSLRTSGDMSPDNFGIAAYQGYTGGVALGNVIGRITDPYGTNCGNAVELVGTVQPSNYRGQVTIRRTFLSERLYTNGTLEKEDTTPSDDTSDQVAIDSDPQSGGSLGKVYDHDAPGASPGEDETGRVRQNFISYAVLGDRSSSKKVSPDLPWFSRVSCYVGPYTNGGNTRPRPVFVRDLPGDNTVGVGSTLLSINLQ